MVRNKKKVALFAKERPHLTEAIDYLKKYTDNIDVFIGDTKDPFPVLDVKYKCDLLISYLSPWIIPAKLLNNTRDWAINFHTGPPEYPGIGCVNFALYNEEPIYGITSHIMEDKVDTGRIIDVIRFKIDKYDSVYSVTQKCYDKIFDSFKIIVDKIFSGQNLHFCGEKWQRRPYTRNELNSLCEITCRMDENEINRRIRAVTYPGKPGAFIRKGNHVFIYSNNKGQ